MNRALDCRVDPITIIVGIALLAGLGAGGMALVAQGNRDKMREAVRAPISCGDSLVLSLFDVFWDLGANEFTLEMLAHRELLMTKHEELASLITQLPERIAEHEGYKGFVDDLLVSIEEYRKSNRPTEEGRLLEGPRRKLLPMPKSPQTVNSEVLGPEAASAEDAQKRQKARSEEHHGGLLSEPTDSQQIDIDQVLETDAMELIGSLFSGEGAKSIKKWFGLRDARKLREELDLALAELFKVYQSELRNPEKGLAHLYHLGKRWDAEAVRVRLLASKRSWQKEDWAQCADALMQEALRLSTELAKSSRIDTDESLTRIDKLAAKGDQAMAGYLVYLNRYAFFAGKLARCERQLRAIETSAHKLRQELRDCRSKGLI